jgi:hypothetical protein
MRLNIKPTHTSEGIPTYEVRESLVADLRRKYFDKPDEVDVARIREGKFRGLYLFPTDITDLTNREIDGIVQDELLPWIYQRIDLWEILDQKLRDVDPGFVFRVSRDESRATECFVVEDLSDSDDSYEILRELAQRIMDLRIGMSNPFYGTGPEDSRRTSRGRFFVDHAL